MPADKTRFDSAIAGLEQDVRYLEKSLEGGKKYLVGDNLTLADLMVTSMLYYSFKCLISPELRKELPNLVGYMEAFAAVPEHKKYYGELEMCEKPLSL